MRESSAFYKELLKEWEEQFGLDSLFMFHEVPRLRLPLSLASTRPADLAKVRVCVYAIPNLPFARRRHILVIYCSMRLTTMTMGDLGLSYAW